MEVEGRYPNNFKLYELILRFFQFYCYWDLDFCKEQNTNSKSKESPKAKHKFLDLIFVFSWDFDIEFDFCKRLRIIIELCPYPTAYRLSPSIL
jgi:hypothetical protein